VEKGCWLCRYLGLGATPAEAHHPRTGTGLGRRAPDLDIIPLCWRHHRGNEGLHGMGRKAWERHYGITESEILWQVKREME
jgi:hypothetical protein